MEFRFTPKHSLVFIVLLISYQKHAPISLHQHILRSHPKNFPPIIHFPFILIGFTTCDKTLFEFKTLVSQVEFTLFLFENVLNHHYSERNSNLATMFTIAPLGKDPNPWLDSYTRFDS